MRVLRTVDKSSLVTTTPYIGDVHPQLSDPSLKDTLQQTRFSWDGRPARLWRNGKPHSSSLLLGNIPPTPQEAALECNAYGGGWHDQVGNEVLLEWRWKHDREALVEEIRKAREELDNRPPPTQTPKKMLPEQPFWEIISLLDWKHTGNDDAVLQPAIKALARMSAAEIKQFQERLAYLLYEIDTETHARNIGEYSYRTDGGHFSTDYFLYVRCAAVANGQAFYNAALKDPAQMPKDLDFEALLGLARAAYEKKTGKDFDYDTGCDYESMSNLKGWPAP